MTDLQIIQAEAEALRAINSAKHKAAGLTHRAEIKIRSKSGAVKQVIVAYLKTDSVPSRTVALARKYATNISDVSITAL